MHLRCIAVGNEAGSPGGAGAAGGQVCKGSELWLLNAVPAAERARKLDEEGTRRELRLENLVLRHVVRPRTAQGARARAVYAVGGRAVEANLDGGSALMCLVYNATVIKHMQNKGDKIVGGGHMARWE